VGMYGHYGKVLFLFLQGDRKRGGQLSKESDKIKFSRLRKEAHLTT
jgi:hypothetical protein